MGKILIIDDDESFLRFMKEYVKEFYPFLEVETCTNPIQGLFSLRGDLDLLVVDLEMPNLDGMKVMKYAKEAGVDKNRIIILSGRDAEYLHERLPMGSCLAVLNKYEARQKAVLDMVFSSLQRKKGGNVEDEFL